MHELFPLRHRSGDSRSNVHVAVRITHERSLVQDGKRRGRLPSPRDVTVNFDGCY